jgi:phage tail-like protein
MAGAVSAAITATRFELSVDGQPLGLFAELKGLTSAIELPEVILTSARGTIDVTATSTRQLPPTVVLRRRLTPSVEMAAWHELAILGNMAAARKSVTLTMYGAKGDAVARFQLSDAWPHKIEITALDSGILMETVTMTCKLLQRVSV